MQNATSLTFCLLDIIIGFLMCCLPGEGCWTGVVNVWLHISKEGEWWANICQRITWQ